MPLVLGKVTLVCWALCCCPPRAFPVLRLYFPSYSCFSSLHLTHVNLASSHFISGQRCSHLGLLWQWCTHYGYDQMSLILSYLYRCALGYSAAWILAPLSACMCASQLLLHFLPRIQTSSGMRPIKTMVWHFCRFLPSYTVAIFD